MLSELWIGWTANRFDFTPQSSTRAEWKLSKTFHVLFVIPGISTPTKHEKYFYAYKHDLFYYFFFEKLQIIFFLRKFFF